MKKKAGPTVHFTGRIPNEATPPLYAGCKAFIFPKSLHLMTLRLPET